MLDNGDSPIPQLRLGRVFAPLLVSLLVLVALLPATRVGFGADDTYLLAHVQSPDWRTRLFAFNVDRPSEHYGAWWEGVRYQRRFVRLLPSALMAAEVATLGQRPWPLHLVSLALHLVNVLLIYRLVRRWLGHAGKAALVAAMFGVHPVAVEPVSWFATQPLLVATTCTLLSVESWIRYRAGEGRNWLFAALVAVFAAVTSYEAAVPLPLLIVAGDVVWLRNDRAAGSRWPARAALVALLVSYFVLVKLNQAGTTALEISHRQTVAEAWTVARVDLANYLFKALGLVQPGRPQDYWIYNALGEPAALLLLILVSIQSPGGRVGVRSRCSGCSPSSHCSLRPGGACHHRLSQYSVVTRGLPSAPGPGRGGHRRSVHDAFPERRGDRCATARHRLHPRQATASGGRLRRSCAGERSDTQVAGRDRSGAARDCCGRFCERPEAERLLVSRGLDWPGRGS